MFHLKRNVPAFERAIRVGLALLAALGALYFLPPGALRLLGWAAAGMLAATAAVGFCPACAMLGRGSGGRMK